MFNLNHINRRHFLKVLSASGLSLAVAPSIQKLSFARTLQFDKPKTNIEDALKYPRNENSMPGKYPGKVVQIISDKCIVENKFIQDTIDEMLKHAMLKLTGAEDISTAWKMFFKPSEIIGLKVNPVAGKELSTSLEITMAIIKQLEAAGIPKKNIVIWDRREFELHEVGFVEEKFPGIKITGTERKDESGSFYNKDGKLYSEEMIDKDWYYWADCEEKYDSETIPYMVNEGKFSYFSKIVTKEVDKIINVPILKNAGASITLCLKNLAYGSITNTGRLHKELWSETSAEVCAFPPLRDKVVLNIVDGIKGCFNGGPGANPQFIMNFNTIFAGTDAVAVDRAGYEIILKKRLEEKIQQQESPKGRKFLELAQNLQLGVADLEKINWEKIII
jgi:hypothetical protein